MIAFARQTSALRFVQAGPAWHAGFLALLPDIRRHLRFAFRQLPIESREEAMQEALALALVAYLRLHELGKTDVAYASPLANYAARQVRHGRKMACPLNACDVLSPYAQRQQGFVVDRMERGDRTQALWKEFLIEDRTCTPAELAASRLDFNAWLMRLPEPKREIAATLAAGETTGGAAKKFQLTSGRISQLRRELADSWNEFQREAPPAAAATG